MFGMGANAQDVKNIGKDPKFITYIRNLAKIPNKSNEVQIQIILSKSNLTEDEQERLAIAFGFNTLQEAVKFGDENSKLAAYLVDKYALKNLKIDELENAISIGIGQVPDLQSETLGECWDTRSNCQLGANAIYGLELVGCVSAGASLGGVSFICGGCVGGAVGTFCVAAAIAHRVAMIEDCNIAYRNCMNGN